MATHEFGILATPPVPGQRFDRYEPEKYHCVPVDEEAMERILPALESIDVYWHSLDVPGKGLACCGITLLQPESIEAVLAVLEGHGELAEWRELLERAQREHRYVIHFGI